MWATTQAPIAAAQQHGGASWGCSEHQVRVIAPFIGGGFGPEDHDSTSPRMCCLPVISMKLSRPIKWIEDRRENFLATTQERDQIHDAEIAVTKDGMILGVKDVFYPRHRRI